MFLCDARFLCLKPYYRHLACDYPCPSLPVNGIFPSQAKCFQHPHARAHPWRHSTGCKTDLVSSVARRIGSRNLPVQRGADEIFRRMRGRMEGLLLLIDGWRHEWRGIVPPCSRSPVGTPVPSLLLLRLCSTHPIVCLRKMVVGHRRHRSSFPPSSPAPSSAPVSPDAFRTRPLVLHFVIC